MLKMRTLVLALGILMTPLAHSAPQVSIGIGFPNVSIGINIPSYPRLVAVPGYPVYYAPGMQENYFFYDGMYWVFQGDDWYASSWYNGPWQYVERYDVPAYVLRVPVRYYRSPPSYFRAWRADAPPRWGNRWGREWEQRRSGWDRWDRRAAPAPAPLPHYQRQYSGNHYPRQVEQRALHQQRYQYQPRDPVVRKQYQERYQERSEQRAPGGQNRPGASEDRRYRQQDMQPSAPRQQYGPNAPRSQSPQRGDENGQWSGPASTQTGRPNDWERRQQAPRSQDRDGRQRDSDTAREQQRNHEQENDRWRDRNN